MTLSPYQRATTYFNNNLSHPLHRLLNARKLYAKVTPLPEGTFKMDYNKISEMGDAIISYEIPDAAIARDGLELSAETVRLAVITRGWEIEYSKWNAFKNNTNIDLPLEYQNAAVRKIAEAEEKVLISNWKPNNNTVRIKGLYEAAANHITDTYDFGTPGKAIEATGAAKAILRDAGVTGVNFNATFANDQYSQLEVSKMPYTGDMEIDRVRAMLNDVKTAASGDIFWSTELAPGTGFISPCDETGLYMELLIGTETRTVLGYDSKIPDISPLYGTTYGVMGPNFYHDECVVDFNSI